MIKKTIRISVVSFLFTSSIIAQSLDTDAQDNGTMTIGNGTGTLMQFAGAQEGTDNTNQAQGGFGIVTGSNQISPVVWMYENTEKNAFQVKRKKYGATVQNGATLFQVGANGNVGIGTNNPTQKFDVNGTAKVGDGNWGALIIDGKDKNDWLLNAHNGGESFAIRTQRDNGENSGAFQVMTFQRSTGNVGIGTTSPQSKLQISNGLSGGNAHGFSELTLEDDDHTMMNLLSPNTKIGYYGFSDNDDDFVGGMQYYHNTDRMEFRVNNHQESDMLINATGNVGIGTNTPDAKLAVNGNIHTKEVKVDLIGWADYVFKEDYKLPTLEEVEDHIATKGHLINIPSAAEVAENGIQLGEMNAKLLEKIEELTLYTIAQEKRIKSLEGKLEKVLGNN
ncbi:tail fiber protein [uncultured Aquimarina sp.]|uniref:tail fiber protein n=1 Tax=uncultured Aquimarina sp. TaxID=575652 RepID=UPI00260DC362|nr:tail fiber protein [uncultured Aquimarina sp.]